MVILVINGTNGTVTKGFKEEFGSHSRRRFNRFTTEGSYTRNVAHNMDSSAV
jgi:hypothetical protein